MPEKNSGARRIGGTPPLPRDGAGGSSERD
jgi:hypothetical protein